MRVYNESREKYSKKDRHYVNKYDNADDAEVLNSWFTQDQLIIRFVILSC